MLSVNYDGLLEKRLVKRGKQLSQSLLGALSSSIQRISTSRAEQIGFYRFLNNDNVSENILIEEQRQRCSQLSAQKTVLCISDTTETNFFHHLNRLKKGTGLGYTAAPKGIGFLAHVCIAVDAKTYFPYGITDLKLWHRLAKTGRTNEQTYKLPISEKESNKWIEGCKRSNEILTNASSVIHIHDREGDIYEQLMDLPQDDITFYIIRSNFNRTTDKDYRLYQQLEHSTPTGTYNLELSGEGNSKHQKGLVTMEVRMIKTKIKRPRERGVTKDLKPFTEEITLIETRQINVKQGEEGICWRLLTTCSVNTLEDACQVIEWYTVRWIIEELFRVVKKENLDIEESELESGWALRKLFILLIDTAIKLFQLYICRDIEEGETLESIASFSPDEFKCLEKVQAGLEGKTEKQKNPYKQHSTQWVLWILARLGGWKGYQSQRKPGMTTIINGLDRFYTLFNGWVLNNSE